MIKSEHIVLTGVPALRIGLLALAYYWSGYLLWRKLRREKATGRQQLAAWLVIMASSSLVAVSWVMMFFVW